MTRAQVWRVAWTSMIWPQCRGPPEQRRSFTQHESGWRDRPKGSKGRKCQVKESPLSFLPSRETRSLLPAWGWGRLTEAPPPPR